jgi:hypothetical protein
VLAQQPQQTLNLGRLTNQSFAFVSTLIVDNLIFVITPVVAGCLPDSLILQCVRAVRNIKAVSSKLVVIRSLAPYSRVFLPLNNVGVLYHNSFRITYTCVHSSGIISVWCMITRSTHGCHGPPVSVPRWRRKQLLSRYPLFSFTKRPPCFPFAG